MKSTKIFCLVLLVPFTAVTLYALAKVGYVGIFTYHLPSPAGWQVFTDLVVALALVLAYMIRDARRSGRTIWPYVIATLFLGSFGPLAYLLFGRGQKSVSKGG